MCVIKCWIYGLTNEKIIIPAYSYPPPPKTIFFFKVHALSHLTYHKKHSYQMSTP